jgi:iron complex transport system ATP-binding protein
VPALWGGTSPEDKRSIEAGAAPPRGGHDGACPSKQSRKNQWFPRENAILYLRQVQKRPPILEVRALSVVRSGQTILDNVSWRIERGQHWVILGANGSGKTSLLIALTAYLTPSSGEIEVLGAGYGKTDWRELRKQVGLVSSSIRQMIGDEMTAIGIVAGGRDAIVNPWVRVSAAERQRAAEFLRQTETLALAKRPWQVLSQGERQRVLIARALMADPPLLILDEPCAGLDPVARERFVAFLGRLGRKRGGPAIILVTHHVEEIAPVFTHALLLRQGTVVASGAKAAVLTSANLSQVFGAPLRLRREASGNYKLSMRIPSTRKLM